METAIKWALLPNNEKTAPVRCGAGTDHKTGGEGS
jgi:hypothetical protein